SDIVRLKNDGTFELNLRYFRHHNEKVEYEWDNGEPKMGNVASVTMSEILRPARDPKDDITDRHRDIARSAQAMYEEAFFHLLNRLHDKYRIDAVALAGGCAMNSVANGKVY